MIEPTDEMETAYDEAAWENPVELGGLEMANVREGLKAVLAIVERDYPRIEIEPCGRHSDHNRHIWVNPGAYADCVCRGLP